MHALLLLCSTFGGSPEPKAAAESGHCFSPSCRTGKLHAGAPCCKVQTVYDMVEISLGLTLSLV
eukprot:1134371-Pelagomonas_calceolata.AAC.4